jgi:thiosulfate/3-mercaptopyruvate sulfurtransferase
MKVSKIFGSILSILMFMAVAVSAQTDVISAQEFMDLRKSSDDLVILDANTSKNYNAAHIKDALFVNHNDLYKKGDIAGIIQSPRVLAAYFGKLGITKTTPVVVTDDGSQKYNARVYWILKYLGAENVKLLHKDMGDWRKARVPLTSTPGKATPATFVASVNPAILADLAYVKANKDKGNVMMIDCRTADEYSGAASNSDGHIPGAININYVDLLTANGAFKSKAELTAIAKKYGITADTELILYCRTSVRATPAYVAFKNILGYDKVKVYDGAYLEWSANYPVQ